MEGLGLMYRKEALYHRCVSTSARMNGINRNKTKQTTPQFIGSVNVRGCIDGPFAVIEEAKRHGQKLCFIQETHIRGDGVYDLDGWQFIYSGMKKLSTAGVAMVISPDVNILEYKTIDQRRIIHARLIMDGVKTSAWSVYASIETYAESTKINIESLTRR